MCQKVQATVKKTVFKREQKVSHNHLKNALDGSGGSGNTRLSSLKINARLTHKT